MSLIAAGMMAPGLAPDMAPDAHEGLGVPPVGLRNPKYPGSPTREVFLGRVLSFRSPVVEPHHAIVQQGTWQDSLFGQTLDSIDVPATWDLPGTCVLGAASEVKQS